MNTDILNLLQEKKQRAKALIEKAASFGWIDAERGQALVKKLDDDTLTIAVIGQMKCGKSTFLNTFVFGREVLPAATTPMTAALTVITYGAQKVVAEFYTQQEWDEQLRQSRRSLDEAKGDALTISSIKAAKELVEKSQKLGGEITSLLGTTRDDSLDNLVQYVGADGLYVSITKSVTIYYPDERLKGVEVVDTPGFNDPIVSREERTKSFLNKADVVLLMLYAGRPFDATDREIIFKHVAQCGMGKILMGINKYDIPYSNHESEAIIKQYVKDELRKACNESNNHMVAEICRGVEPIPVSALMALLARMDKAEIDRRDDLKFAFDRFAKIFNISSADDFYRLSHIEELSAAVMKMIDEEKAQILFVRPINAVVSAGVTKRQTANDELYKLRELLANLNASDEELEEKNDNLRRAERRTRKKVQNLADELDSAFLTLISDGTRKLQGIVDDNFRNINAAIDRLQEEGQEQVMREINNMISNMKNFELNNFFRDFGGDVSRKMKSLVSDFVDDIDEVFENYLPDYNRQSMEEQVSRQINDIVDQLNSFDAVANVADIRSDGERFATNGLSWILTGVEIFGGPISQLVGSFANAFVGGFAYSRVETMLRAQVDQMRSSINTRSIMEQITSQKTVIIDTVQKSLIDDVITPLKNQLSEAQTLRNDKVRVTEETQTKLANLQAEITRLNREASEIETLKNEIIK